MSRYTGPTTRINRRFGMAIFPANKAFEEVVYPPGQHDLTLKNRDYGEGLVEKQSSESCTVFTEK